MQLSAAGRKSCRVLNPVELFTMTFQADSKWQDLTPSKLKKQYDKDKQAGEEGGHEILRKPCRQIFGPISIHLLQEGPAV